MCLLSLYKNHILFNSLADDNCVSGCKPSDFENKDDYFSYHGVLAFLLKGKNPMLEVEAKYTYFGPELDMVSKHVTLVVRVRFSTYLQ